VPASQQAIGSPVLLVEIRHPIRLVCLNLAKVALKCQSARTRGTDHQDRLARVPHHLVGHTNHNPAAEAAASVSGHVSQANVFLLGVLCNLHGRPTPQYSGLDILAHSEDDDAV
jgi:hypothetical protein